MTISADEFLRRFLIHVPPKGLVRIRHFGLFAEPQTNRIAAASLPGAVRLGLKPPSQPSSTSQPEVPIVLRTDNHPRTE